jgi:biopolymer transport protein ExbD
LHLQCRIRCAPGFVWSIEPDCGLRAQTYNYRNENYLVCWTAFLSKSNGVSAHAHEKEERGTFVGRKIWIRFGVCTSRMQLSAVTSAPLASVFLILMPVVLTSLAPSRGFPVFIAEPNTDCGDWQAYVVQAFSDGTMRLNMEPITFDTLEGRLRTVFSFRAEKLLFVKADPDVPFETVARIIEIGSRQAFVAILTKSVAEQSWQRPNCGITIGHAAEWFRLWR